MEYALTRRKSSNGDIEVSGALIQMSPFIDKEVTVMEQVRVVRTAGEVGAMVRAGRRRLGLTQEALAQQAGVGRAWLVEVEGGKPRAELEMVLRVLATLDLRVELSPCAADVTER